jgi:choline-sulfatase
MTRRDFLKQSLGGAAAVATSSVLPAQLGAAEPAQSRRPNILLLMTDQHRGDCLGVDGNQVIRTPNIDQLAREGVRFRHGYSCTPTCTPARAALLTGMGPWKNGMLGYGKVAEHYPVELPRALREAGYHTLGIGKMHWSPQRSLHGFHRTLLDESGRVLDKGFESDYRAWFREHAPKGMTPDDTGIGWNDHRAAAYALPEEFHPTRWIGDTAIDFLDSYRKEEPFFLKVSWERPHSPYDPPKRFLEAYREDEMPAPAIGDWAAKHAKPGVKHPDDLWEGDLGIAEVRKSRRGYYGSISYVDEQIGRIRATLEKRGLLENTFILFVSDHGDMTGDHHLWRKCYPFESSARVPFFVRPPGSMKVERGQVLDQCVEIRDVLPTFADVAGAKVTAPIDGRSVLPLLRGKASRDGAKWRPWIDLEHHICYAPSNNYTALTDGHFKYIYHAQFGEEQFFNLNEDPTELHDLATDAGQRSRMRDWRHELVGHLSQRGDKFVLNGDLVPRPKGQLYSPNYPKGGKSGDDAGA